MIKIKRTRDDASQKALDMYKDEVEMAKDARMNAEYGKMDAGEANVIIKAINVKLTAAGCANAFTVAEIK